MSKETKFDRLASSSDVSAAEAQVIAYWDRADVFRRSISERPGENPFVFYEGPPTANGRPGVHHVIARLTKDLVCRYKTMRGHRVVRKAGWDTHGLPVEIEVEKQLGFKHKEEIESYGIAEFNQKCRESVFRYEKDWVEFTRRIGYWVDMEHPYVTLDNRYIESVWWILKEFWKADLIYQGHRIVPYCPRCETSLSSHEVSLGYRDVSDPSIFVKFQRRDADEKLLVWTTTPWTLISNVALAVGPDHDYARVRHGDETLVLAEALLGVLDGDYEVLDRVKGSELVGAGYEPLFDFYADAEGAFVVLGADFVSLDDGTGIVHIAPAFGEDDFNLHREHGIPLIQAVTPGGTFVDAVTPWAGQFIKDADPGITQALKTAGKLYKSGKVKHSYPFCWRCDSPLVYYARRCWYIRTTGFKSRMIEANREIGWIPAEVGAHRFGDWLENNVDWSLSRERFWGTPLNIWVCDGCGFKDSVGSIEELKERAAQLPEGDLDLHRPWVDEVVLSCPQCEAAEMHRVPEVIDVWFDSGSMPFAQYHYPWDEDGMFESQFPADYISEGIDQCRGWFYSLLAISVFLKGTSPYKHCLTTEMILDRHGQKMSKSKGNTVDPWEVLDASGADAMRWYLATTSSPWSPTRFDTEGIKESSRKMLDTLRNVYSFFAMYASIDDYTHDPGEVGERNLLDRWLLSRYHTVSARVGELLDTYEVTRAARLLQAFTLDELSNWYVRRSRRRFWKGEMGPDKHAAYHTLFTVLDGLARLVAPYAPFVAEELYLALRGHSPRGEADGASVHLEMFPEPDIACIDTGLEREMALALAVCSLGRTVRNDTSLRVRQPLAKILVHTEDRASLEALLGNEQVVDLVLDELNVKAVAGADALGTYVVLSAKPNFPALGKRFGKRVPAVATAIRALETTALLEFNRTGTVAVTVDGESLELSRDEISAEVAALEGFGAAQDRGVTVVVDVRLSDELRMEGAAREIVNRVQNLRKQAGLEVTDRIRLRHQGAESVFASQGGLIAAETLAVDVAAGKADWDHSVELDLGDLRATFWIQKTD